MNDTSNNQNEKTIATSRLESLSHDELIKLIKSQFVSKKKLETKISELTEMNTKLCQTEEKLRHEIDEERSKNVALLESFRQENFQQNQNQQELDVAVESLPTDRSETKILSICKEILRLELNIPNEIDENYFHLFRNELESKQEKSRQAFEQFEEEKSRLQQRLEDLEFFNEEMKLEMDDLRNKSSNYQKEIGNYRRQIEDFEEQFLEVQRESRNHLSTQDKCQSTSSLLFEMNSSEQENSHSNSDQTCPIEKSSSNSSLILNSDIPKLLHSVGIVNVSDEDFTIPLNFDSVLRLSTLLVERCRILQMILLKQKSNIDENFQRESILSETFEDHEQCQIEIHQQEHLAFDEFIEKLYLWSNEKVGQKSCRLILSKPFNQYQPPYLRLEIDDFHFVSAKVENDLIRARTQLDQLSKEIRRKDQQINDFQNKIDSNNTLQQLKQRQIELEEQLAEQCEKTSHLENILQHENIDRIRLNQLEEIQCSYEQLLEKYRVAEQIQNQMKHIEENSSSKDQQIREQEEKLKRLSADLQREHLQRIEAEDKFRSVTVDLENNETLLEKYQNQLNRINEEFQQQKKLVLSLTKQQGNQITEENFQNHSNDRDDEQNENRESELIKLREENEKLRKTLTEINEKMENSTDESKENFQDLKEKNQKMKLLLTRLKKELQDKSQQPKQSLIDLEFADYEKTMKNLKDDLNSKEKEIEELREELFSSNEKSVCFQREIENLEKQKSQNEQRAEKFKNLFETTKKELEVFKELQNQNHHNDDQSRLLIDKLHGDLEKTKYLLNEVIQEKQQLIEKFNQQKENHEKTIRILEQNSRISQHELDIAKKDYETLQDDFNNYKIRAQNVLKQQTSQRDRTPSTTEKQVELESLVETLKGTLREANNKMQLIISENEILQKEQDRLIENQAKLTHESRKREQDLRKQHHIEIEKLENQWLKRLTENEDTIKILTIQNETQSTAFKEQILTIESDYQRSTSLLQSQLDNANEEIEQTKILLNTLKEKNENLEKLVANFESSPIGINSQKNRVDNLAWSVSERRRVEESESTSNENLSEEIDVNTLQNVLFMDSHSGETSMKSNPGEKLRPVFSESPPFEQQRLEEELNKTRLRLLDTTELLTESESNNVRLSEQVALLKDEIRRIERSMDRIESISNLEYLKNVIFKFFVLKSSPERLQLIPVLVTMLKLSPNEQAQLVRVANSSLSLDDSSSTNQEPSGTQSVTNISNHDALSWGSYLNIW